MLVWSTWHKQVRTLPASNPMREISRRFCRHLLWGECRKDYITLAVNQVSLVECDNSSGGNTVLETSFQFLSPLLTLPGVNAARTTLAQSIEQFGERSDVRSVQLRT